MSEYGAYYWDSGSRDTYEGPKDDLYSYKAFIGESIIPDRDSGGSLIYLSDSKETAIWTNSEEELVSKHFAVHLPAYQCGNKTVSVDQRTNLPYVNGCSTRQIFSPERVGDPTLQQLTIPPYTAEQMHHIHTTPRVVYVLRGRGYSIVGQADSTKETALLEGMVCILDPMCPHHFRTEDSPLTVLPVHVWSSTPSGLEANHPMFNGTKEV